MRLTGLFVLSLGVVGPLLIDAEKVIFVVPRYIRRSFPSPPKSFFNNGDHDQNLRQPGKRPDSSAAHGGTRNFEGQFFPDEKPRFPVASHDFDQRYTIHRPNHVVGSQGKGIRFVGKPYVPYDDIKQAADNYMFSGGNHNVDFDHNNDLNEFKFESSRHHGGFQNQEQFNQPDWAFPSSAALYGMTESHRPSQQTNTAYDDSEKYKDNYPTEIAEPTQAQSAYPQSAIVEESRAILPAETSMLPQPAALVAPAETTRAPIVLRDIVDMRDYVQKMEAFTKNWSSIRNGFGWPNQIGRPAAFAPTTNYQNFSPWSVQYPRQSNGYAVQEDVAEERSSRNHRPWF